MTVWITFQSPSLNGRETPGGLHERRLQGVPRDKARSMAEDFTAYESKREGRRRKLYRYNGGGEERLIALDFEEVVAIVATSDTS